MLLMVLVPDKIERAGDGAEGSAKAFEQTDKRSGGLVRIGENYPALLHLLPDKLRQQIQNEQREKQ
jgi:hypothetical protein